MLPLPMNMLANTSLNKGIAAGLIAGVFWGTTFVAPLLLKNFSALEITFGRFFFFGVVSLFNIVGVVRLIKLLPLKDMCKILLLSAIGFWLYTLILFEGVQLTNGVIASLIIGCLPITFVLFAQPTFDARLISGLALIFLGILCLLIVPLLISGAEQALLGIEILGVVFLLVALAMWTWFGVSNAHFMAGHQSINPMDYASCIGLINIVCMSLVFVLLNGFSTLSHHAELSKFLFWTAVLGLGASWLANIFWAYSAKRCPASVGGALMVSETLFGLLYSFLFEQRWPYLNELLAILFLIVGVYLVIHSQHRNAS